MPLTKVGKRHQVTIPKEIFERLKLKEGDHLEVVDKDNTIVFIPSKVIPKDQEWFYTKEWQDKEREADEDIAKGNISGPFDNAEDLLKSLKS